MPDLKHNIIKKPEQCAEYYYATAVAENHIMRQLTRMHIFLLCSGKHKVAYYYMPMSISQFFSMQLSMYICPLLPSLTQALTHTRLSYYPQGETTRTLGRIPGGPLSE